MIRNLKWAAALAAGIAVITSVVLLQLFKGRDGTNARPSNTGLATTTQVSTLDQSKRSMAAVVKVPTVDSLPDQALRTAQGIFERLAEVGFSRDSCLELRPAFARLANESQGHADLWQWAFRQIEICVMWLSGYEEKRSFVEDLLHASSGNPDLLITIAKVESTNAQSRLAVEYLKQALGKEESAHAWDLLGGEELSLAIRSSETSHDLRAREELLSDARRAMGRAIELAGANADAWMYQRLARVNAELGDAQEAITWADKAILALKQGGDSYIEGYAAAALYFEVGVVYYKVGQHKTGVAYMDQGIGLAAPGDRSRLSDSRRQYLQGRS